MKTRRMFLIALCGVAMLIGAGSCKKEKQENENGETMVIKASIGGSDSNSKTHLNGPSVIWDQADAFKLFPAGSTEGSRFALKRIEEGGTVAYFEGTHPGNAPYYACYPFNNASCTTSGSTFTYTYSLPQVQNGSPETVSGSTNAGPMIGYMKNASGSLTFQNVMSWLKVGLKGNAAIKRVVLTDTGGNMLNGTLTVSDIVVGNDDKISSFTTAMSGGTNQLEIVSEEGIQLNGTTPEYFWFQVPAGSLANLNLSAYLDVEGTRKVLDLNRTIENGIGQNRILTANVNSPIIEGALPGVFSVSATKKVYFSKGNLQYNMNTTPDADKWRFAPTQYERIGSANKANIQNTTATTDIWIDLFSWGTSGYDYGPTHWRPYDYEGSPTTYGPSTGNLTVAGQSDWGANAISNGGNEAGEWRTLTGDTGGEWNYLLYQRTKPNPRYTNTVTSSVTIDGNDYKGLFIYPDDYKGTEVGVDETTNTWNKIDALGIVFLPTAGHRNSSLSVSDVGSRGYYWSSTRNDNTGAFHLDFYKDNVSTATNNNRIYGNSVRLVTEVPAER